jgi:hypothetical protein
VGAFQTHLVVAEGPMPVIRFVVLPIVGATALASVAAAQQLAKPPDSTAAPAGNSQPLLLGQYADWGAYTASPKGGKVCFALSMPVSSKTEPDGGKREQAYIFIATRPAEKVKNEVSVIIGYPFKSTSDATAEIGIAKFGMYTKEGGAWIKNVADEARMIDAMRKGADLTIKGTSGRAMRSIDQYSHKGLAQALDRAEQECK